MFLFAADPMTPRLPDPLYSEEVEAARLAGKDTALLAFEALVDENDAMTATHRVSEQGQEVTGIYRGWMLKPTQYAELYDALAAKNVRLINSPRQYRMCHWLPDWYPLLSSLTPRSAWVPTDGDVDIDALRPLLRPLGDKPLILKDYVKSRKHEWADACYIPSASDAQAVERVVRRFIQLQGNDLNGGLVFREYVEFEPLAAHPKSGMPMTVEYRIFFLDGEPISVAPHWDEGEYAGEAPPLEVFRQAAREIPSRFFSVDVAKRRDGDWMIVELGDGQVTGLPERADRTAFYRALATV